MVVFKIISLFILFVSVHGDSECDVVTKEEWDALTPVHEEDLIRPVDLVIIQHTVTRPCKTDAKCEEIVRAIQNNHVENLKHADIASSFIIGGNGKIYEGTGWYHVGSHTSGYNNRSIGISFIGNYNHDFPEPESIEAVRTLLRCGVDNGHLTSNYHVVGHNQLIATQSPGRKLYNEIRTWSHYLDDVRSIIN